MLAYASGNYLASMEIFFDKFFLKKKKIPQKIDKIKVYKRKMMIFQY
jgi:hypothetical protein